MASPVAVLTGTWNKPALRVYFNPHQEHPGNPEKTLLIWMEEYIIEQCQGQAYWSSKYGCWNVTATGPDPERKFMLAGIPIDFSETNGTNLQNVVSINELATPTTPRL